MLAQKILAGIFVYGGGGCCILAASGCWPKPRDLRVLGAVLGVGGYFLAK
jgi:hypothetical protein